MDSSKASAAGKPAASGKPAGAGEDPNLAATPADDAAVAVAAEVARPPSRTPFTSLSQEDADLALARTLQEQEHAYMMLQMGVPAGNGYYSSGSGSFADIRDEYYDEEDDYEDYDDDGVEEYREEVAELGEVIEREEDAFDVHARAEEDGEETFEGEEVIDALDVHAQAEENGEETLDGEEDIDAFHAHDLSDEEEEDEDEYGEDDVGDEIDPSAFESDEAYARALQEAEERDVVIRLMGLTGINDWHRVAVAQERGGTSRFPNSWQRVDPDELSYEELVALGDVVGTESRGLSKDIIGTLPSVTYKAQKPEDENTEQCVICRLEYDDGENLVALPCKHIYHPDCINNWLQINKVCPVCSKEVSLEENGSDDDVHQ